MKFNFFLFFLFVGLNYAYATQRSLPENIYQSTRMNENQISKFMVGQWKLATASCLSETPIHWAEPLESIQYEFNDDQSFLFKTFRSGQLIHSQKGTYNVEKQLLKVITNQYCNHYDESASPFCSPIDERSSSFTSIQKQQLWVLVNSGPIDGLCPLNDIVLVKLDRL